MHALNVFIGYLLEQGFSDNELHSVKCEIHNLLNLLINKYEDIVGGIWSLCCLTMPSIRTDIRITRRHVRTTLILASSYLLCLFQLQALNNDIVENQIERKEQRQRLLKKMKFL